MDVLDRSIIVAAHPDDENLWFSSILSRVDRIVLCFLEMPSNPARTESRRRSIESYPLANLSCLNLPESEVFWGVDWRRPVESEYGLLIADKQLSDKAYIANFSILKQRLRHQLRGCQNVFTHNPWGEYGHPEHVQVYRAVKALQQELRFNLWYSNYASNISSALMTRVLTRSGIESVMLETDKVLAERIAEIYKSEGCWTWFKDYTWPDYESFIKDGIVPLENQRYGAGLSINFLKVESWVLKPSRLSMYATRIRGRAARLRKSIGL